jgi:hypothetical protein
MWWLFALPALADTVSDAARVAALLVARLPEPAVQRLRDNPARALSDAAEVILGHGANGAIGPEGIERAVAVDRAAARARRMAGLLAADLDNDGVVTRAEADDLTATLAADDRGRLLVAMAAADSDGDGRVDMAELRLYGDSGRYGAYRTERLRGLMVFDLDGDTRVTLDEVTAGVQALQAPDQAHGPPSTL